jgi:glycosyltransferase involved in cell wall biosynthesis
VLRELAGRSKANVEFVIHPSDEVLRKLYRGAEALIFPAEEDFGIVAVEAQACGTPVVALGKGGSLETVVDGETGVLVPEQTEEEMTAGLEILLRSKPAASRCRHNAERYSTQRFSEELIDWVSRCVADRGDACTV